MQWAAAVALDVDMSPTSTPTGRNAIDCCEGIEQFYEIAAPGGAFYVFPDVPPARRRFPATEFVVAGRSRTGCSIIPGKIFSQRDTHFRISYAADDRTIDRGIEALRRLAAA